MHTTNLPSWVEFQADMQERATKAEVARKKRWHAGEEERAERERVHKEDCLECERKSDESCADWARSKKEEKEERSKYSESRENSLVQMLTHFMSQNV